MAAITVSGRHALLVGYQPDEALRPSLATLFLSLFPSLPLCPVPPLSFSRPLSKSPRLTPLQAEEREFIDGTLYLHARLSHSLSFSLSALARADGLLEKSRANVSGLANYSLSRDTDPHFLHAFDTVDTG